jgi:antitoxin VapB
MSQVAKLFMHGRSQAERLPVAFRFNTDEVFIRQDPETWGVILSRKTESLDGFLAALKEVEVPADFLRPAERQQGEQNRDPLAGWAE